jgi:RNA polymerase sigma factor (sigma-70 family)
MQELLYHKFSPKMYAVCLRYSGSQEDARDLLQEGFIKIFKNLSKYRGDGSFEGWIRRIFVNTSIEHFRKKVHLQRYHENDK